MKLWNEIYLTFAYKGHRSLLYKCPEASQCTHSYTMHKCSRGQLMDRGWVMGNPQNVSTHVFKIIRYLICNVQVWYYTSNTIYRLLFMPFISELSYVSLYMMVRKFLNVYLVLNEDILNSTSHTFHSEITYIVWVSYFWFLSIWHWMKYFWNQHILKPFMIIMDLSEYKLTEALTHVNWPMTLLLIC